jgi:hypothetical protein
MATLYYVKDGSRPYNSGPGRNISLAELERRVQGKEIKYLGETPPEFNRNSPSKYPLRVVVEVEAHEAIGDLFSRAGFYLFPQLSPEEAEALIFPKA